VPTYQKAILQRVVRVGQSSPDLIGKHRDVLSVLEDLEPEAMFVCLDSLQTFEHLVAFEIDSTSVTIKLRQFRCPRRMSMQNGAGRPRAGDYDMQ
jgi:hypothetical protein